MQHYLITGGAGFIGSNFVHYLLGKYQDCQVVNLDLLTYAGNLANLADIQADPRYHFVQGNITDQHLVEDLIGQYQIDVLVNFAAESHVDRSISGPELFFETNTRGTWSLLEAARKRQVGKFVQISTDEVYGSLGQTGSFTEKSPLDPSSPYSASKAAAEMLVLGHATTYGMDVNITRSSNNYGPYQYPEKLLPLLITNAIEGRDLPIYGDGQNVRDWLYVEDNCSAIDQVIQQGHSGAIYNVSAHNERTNNQIADLIAERLDGKIQYIADRPGHDFRYALDAGKLERELGWQPRYEFAEGLEKTIQWYLDQEDWWRQLKG